MITVKQQLKTDLSKLPFMTKHVVPAWWMRGGTSKGLFFLPEDLPTDSSVRDAVLLAAIGSPDEFAKQIDGIGGATSSTSKICIVGKSGRDDCVSLTTVEMTG